MMPEVVALSLRVRGKFGWSESEAQEVAFELHYALIAKSMDNENTSVSPVLDALWHELIIETRVYADFCQRVLGGTFLHHSTATADDPLEKKNARISRLLMIYASIFTDKRPIEWIWAREEEEDHVIGQKRKEAPVKPLDNVDGVQFYIKDADGTTKTMRLALNDTVEFCKQLFAKRTGRSCVDSIRLIFAGRQLEDGHTLAHYNVTRDCTLHHVSRLRGC